MCVCKYTCIHIYNIKKIMRAREHVAMAAARAIWWQREDGHEKKREKKKRKLRGARL